MSRLTTDALAAWREEARGGVYPTAPALQARVAVHLGTCGVAAGAAAVEAAFAAALAESGRSDIALVSTGCAGFCSQEPMATVEVRGVPPVIYGRLDADKARRVFAEHVLGEQPVDAYSLGSGWDQIPFFQKQRFVVLRNRGAIDPRRIDHYLARDGYLALERALTAMSPEEVIAEITVAGLRGRGGAGFPTGRKWGICRSQSREPKFLVANCDEGDPGAFMDRSLLESDPHSVLEGMVIAAYAIGARRGYVYIRSEYPLALERMRAAIEVAAARGLLGDDILGSGFGCAIEVREGSGAFVCGEETSLLHSIEGEDPEPSQRPPYPAEAGLWGCPTVINNVETLANVAAILAGSATGYARMGTESSKGTKIFSLVGKVTHTGLIEVPMGLTLREIVYDIGGGIPGEKRLKAVQTGGPSGGCIPADLVDLPIDYESLQGAGTMMGSGGMIVMDEETCMVDIAKFFIQFTNDESCGKCSACREGSSALAEVLERITRGEGREGDLDFLDELSLAVKDASMCGLGTTLPNPVLSTLRYFRDEYAAHIDEKRCPALVCKDLIRYYIVPEKCVGCILCLDECPAGAIQGERKHVHLIDQTKCSKCGQCLEVCPPKVAAVVKLTGEEARELKTLERPLPVKQVRDAASGDRPAAH